MKSRDAFTLIELLIVVAIIAILAAIAVPNFLEAQTRSKVSRAQADMRSLATAIEAYRVDYNGAPAPWERFSNYWTGGSEYPEWWGFVPFRLTTPVAYMASLPRMVFLDEGNPSVSDFWVSWTGTAPENQPYTYVYDPKHMLDDNPEVTAGGSYSRPGPDTIPQPFEAGAAASFVDRVRDSSWFLYTSGPDGVDSTVYVFPAEYDPTNGTVSFGDIYRFGTGNISDSGLSRNRFAVGNFR